MFERLPGDEALVPLRFGQQWGSQLNIDSPNCSGRCSTAIIITRNCYLKKIKVVCAYLVRVFALMSLLRRSLIQTRPDWPGREAWCMRTVPSFSHVEGTSNQSPAPTGGDGRFLIVLFDYVMATLKSARCNFASVFPPFHDGHITI